MIRDIHSHIQHANQQARAAVCPRCHAPAGEPCRGQLGQPLAGVHIQRTGANRRAFSIAIHALYAPLQAQAQANKNPGSLPGLAPTL